MLTKTSEKLVALFFLLLLLSCGLYLVLVGAGLPTDLLRLAAVSLLGILSGGIIFLIARLVANNRVQVDFVVSTIIGLITTFTGFFFVPLANSDPVPPPPRDVVSSINEKPHPSPEAPSYLVLSMGVTHYREGGILKAGESDANLVASLFGSRPDVRVRSLLGAQCTKGGIERFIFEQLSSAGTDTTLIVFISMRGVSYTQDQASGYLIPFDASIDGSTEFPFVRSQGYKVLALLQAIHASDVRKALVLVDSCNGFFRNFDESERAATASPNKNVYVVAGPREGWQIDSFEQSLGALALALQVSVKNDTVVNCTQLGPMVYAHILGTYATSLPTSLYPWHGFWSGNQDFVLPATIHAKTYRPSDTNSSLNPRFLLASSVDNSLISILSVDLGNELPSMAGTIPTIPQYGSIEIPTEIQNQIVSLQRDPTGEVHERVIASARKIIEEKTDAPLGHYLLAQALSDSDHTIDEALKHAEIAVQLEPLLGGGYGVVGYCQTKLGHYAAAIEAADEAVRLLPQDPNSWNGLGYALRKFGEAPDSQLSPSAREKLFHDAVAALNNAIERSRDLDDLEIELVGAYYFNRGRCFHALKNYEEAIQDYKKSLTYKSSLSIRILRKDSLASAEAHNPPPAP